ncbi:unnamed protein product [Prunus armeniaca]
MVPDPATTAQLSPKLPKPSSKAGPAHKLSSHLLRKICAPLHILANLHKLSLKISTLSHMPNPKDKLLRTSSNSQVTCQMAGAVRMFSRFPPGEQRKQRNRPQKLI